MADRSPSGARARTQRSGHLRTAVIALALGVGTTAFLLPGGTAQAGGPTVPSYDVLLTLRTDGILHVHEVISYDYGAQGGTGISRPLPYRIGDQVLRITRPWAGSTTGAPAAVRIRSGLSGRRLAVGGDRRVTGLQVYVLDYDVAGAVRNLADHAELTWDAVAASAPVAAADVRLALPAGAAATSCQAGRADRTTGCAEITGTEYAQSGLAPGEGMRITVALPAGAVTAPPPRLAAPLVSVGPAGLAGLVGVLGLAAAGLATEVGSGLRRGLGGYLYLVLGTILVVGGVVDVARTLESQLDQGGVQAISLGDAVLFGLAAAVLGTVLAVFGRRERPAVSRRNAACRNRLGDRTG